jgi:nucleolar GTP-binding protein
MLNKIDITPFDQLTPENQEMINDFLKTEGVKFYKTSNVSKEGIMDMRNAACDELLVQVNTFLRY